MTQDMAAQKVQMARTTLVAIEAGKREISLGELRSLASLYGVAESDLLDEGRSALELTVEFRSSASSSIAHDEAEAAATLAHLANATLQLESLTGLPAPTLDMPVFTLTRTDSVEQQAEDAATALRTRLGLGVGPISNLLAVMESDLGLRVFERPIPSTVSGAVAYEAEAGAFVLLNSKHPLERRRMTASHEMAHVGLRHPGVIVHVNEEAYEERVEKFCDRFGAAFLMPAVAVRRKAAELLELVGRFTVRELLTMALYFDVAMEAMTRRMVALGMLKQGTHEQLKSEGLSNQHRDAVKAVMGLPDEPRHFTSRTLLLAAAAYDKELLSEQQIASMLQLDLVTVRDAMSENRASGGNILEMAG